MTDYHLLFATDKNYLPYLFVLTQSILDNIEDAESNSQDRLVFHVQLDESVQDQVFVAYKQAFCDFNANSKITFTFEPHKVEPSAFYGFNEMVRTTGSSLSTYYRLLVGRIMPKDISRVLYLDIDVLVCADIRNMFKQYPMQNEILYSTTTPGAVFRSNDPFATNPYLELCPRDPKNTQDKYKIPIKDCICAGVLLINLEQWREQNIEEQCIAFGAKWYTPLYDQDILTAVCHGKISYMDWDWQVHSNVLKINNYGKYDIQGKIVPLKRVLQIFKDAPTEDQLQQMCLHPKIVHFTHQKPWNTSEEVVREHFHQIQELVVFIRQWLQVLIRISPSFSKIK